MNKLFVTVTVALLAVATSTAAKKLHYIHWNKNNPMFRLDNTDHIVDVNAGNLPWEYDQVNIICPVSKPGTKFPERHVIYSVSREEFDSCRITNPKPKIVAICNNPYRLMYFTITFRSFTPTPGGLEFRPGQDYYFISTSSREDLHRRVGGGCATHNMKMIFKVADNNGNVEQHYAEEENDIFSSLTEASTPEDNSIDDLLPFDPNFIDDTVNKRRIVVEPEQQPTEPTYTFNSKVPNLRREIYYYHPKDLMDKQEFDDEAFEDSIWRNSLRLTSGSSWNKPTLLSMALIPLLAVVLL